MPSQDDRQKPTLIRHALSTHTLLEFDYHGEHRVVAPYCYGITPRGAEMLRAVQLKRRNSTSARGSFGFGKLWRVEEMKSVRITGESFVPDDPQYNPNDSAFGQILSRV